MDLISSISKVFQDNNPKSKEGEEIGRKLSEKQDGEAVVEEVVKIKKPEFVPKYLNQIMATLIGAFGGLMIGFMFGWADPALRSLECQNDPACHEHIDEHSDASVKFKFDTTPSNQAWIGSIAFLGAVFGTLFVGFFIDRIGRKHTLSLLSGPVLVGWFLTAISPLINQIWVLLLGRFLTGASGGFSFSVTVYVAEIASDKIRGILCGVLPIAIAVGILTQFVLGLWLNYAWLGVFNFLVLVPFVYLIPFLHETPHYLVKLKEIHEATEALKFLRGAKTDEEIQPELDMIIQQCEEDDHATSVTWSEFFSKPILTPIGVSMGLMLFQQWSGIPVVATLPSSIFDSAGSKGFLEPKYGIIVTASTELVVVTIGMILIESLGRKVLLIISEIGICLSLSALGLGMYLSAKSEAEGTQFTLGWIPVASLCSYSIFFNLGIGPIPWIMLGEIIPHRVKETASTIVCSFVWGLTFIILLIFVEFSGEGFKNAYKFLFIFSGLSILGILFVLIFVKETMGKGLKEIHKEYSTYNPMEQIASLIPI